MARKFKNVIDVKQKMGRIPNPDNAITFKIYLDSISKYQPLSRKEENTLFKKLRKTNDPLIREKLCKHNLLFVVAVAKKYAPMLSKTTITLEDLVSEGNDGLCTAIDSFNHNSGNKLISYAVWHIRKQILVCIKDNIKNVRNPCNQQALNKWLNDKEVLLEQKLGRNIDVTEMFDIAMEDKKINKKTTFAKFMGTVDSAKFEKSISDTTGPDSDQSISDLLESDFRNPYDKLNDKDFKTNLITLLDSIPPKIKSFLIDYYGLFGNEELTYREIGEKNNLSSERIRQLINQWLLKLRHTNSTNRNYFLSTTL